MQQESTKVLIKHPPPIAAFLKLRRRQFKRASHTQVVVQTVTLQVQPAARSVAHPSALAADAESHRNAAVEGAVEGAVEDGPPRARCQLEPSIVENLSCCSFRT